jgi:hypothetical protein
LADFTYLIASLIYLGSKRFIEEINGELGRLARGRGICEDGDAYILRVA